MPEFLSSNDGYLFKSNAVYATAHNAVSSDYFEDSDILVGQRLRFGLYQIGRAPFFFNTSTLGGKHIKSAKLRLYVANNYADDHSFTLIIVSGADLNKPPVLADYGGLLSKTVSRGSYYIPDVFHPNPSEWIDIPLNAIGISEINRTGWTKFALRSDRDINSDVPTGNEYIYFESSPGAGPDYAPRLVVVTGGYLGNILIDQLIYQHAERMVR